MGRHDKGWILGGVCFGYGFLKGIWIEGDIVLDILCAVGLCYVIYLISFSSKDADWFWNIPPYPKLTKQNYSTTALRIQKEISITLYQS